MLMYSKNPPEDPGWYWCYQKDDQGPGRDAEFICRVDWYQGVMHVSWMSGPTQVMCVDESQLSDEVLWAGPIPSPARKQKIEICGGPADGLKGVEVFPAALRLAIPVECAHGHFKVHTYVRTPECGQDGRPIFRHSPSR